MNGPAELDSAVPTGTSDLAVKAGEKFTVQARSIIVLRKVA